MANLSYKQVNTNGEYVDFETEMGITLVVGNKYQLGIQNNVVLCVLATKPTSGGFPFNNENFTYTHKGDKLWIRTTYNSAWVNIAEG